MDLQDLIAEIQHLLPQDLERLKVTIAQREQELSQQTKSIHAEAVAKEIDEFLNEFWQDTPEAEQAEIIEAIRIKNFGRS